MTVRNFIRSVDSSSGEFDALRRRLVKIKIGGLADEPSSGRVSVDLRRILVDAQNIILSPNVHEHSRRTAVPHHRRAMDVVSDCIYAIVEQAATTTLKIERGFERLRDGALGARGPVATILIEQVRVDQIKP